MFIWYSWNVQQFHIGATMIHSLLRHGADPQQDATEAIVKMGHAITVDCSPEEATAFLARLKTSAEDDNTTKPIPIILPVLKEDTAKGFLKGELTWKFTWKELFNYEEGAFRMKAVDGYAGWFDVTLDDSKGVFKAKRVKEKVGKRSRG